MLEQINKRKQSFVTATAERLLTFCICIYKSGVVTLPLPLSPYSKQYDRFS